MADSQDLDEEPMAVVENAKTTSLLVKTFRCSRLKASPSLSVADIQGAFKKFLEEQNSWDLAKFIAAPDGAGWKTAPPIKYLARLEPLLQKLLHVAPNTMMTSKKVREALEILGNEKGIHKPRSLSDFMDWADDLIRMCMAHLRELKTNKVSLERALRKGSSQDCDKIKKMLDKIQLKDAWGASPASNASPAEVQQRESPTTAIVPWSPVVADDKQSFDEARGSSCSELALTYYHDSYGDEKTSMATCQQLWNTVNNIGLWPTTVSMNIFYTRLINIVL